MYISGHMMSMPISHSSSSHGCEHIQSQNSICPMDNSGNLSIWQRITAIGSIYSKALLSTPSIIFWVLILASISVTRLNLYIKKKRYRQINLLYVGLFSRGILNSKAY